MFLIANWKMYLDVKESIALARAVKRLKKSKSAELVICPSLLSLREVYQALPRWVRKGAQDGYWVEKGAYTGAVSMAMLENVLCRYVLVGHSERRHQFGENDVIVAKKIRAAWDASLKPIFCIGETKEERKEGRTEDVLRQQLGSVFIDRHNGIGECLLVYEPVWAISRGGVGEPCTAQHLREVLTALERLLRRIGVREKVQLLYGGSVEPENICSFLEVPGVEGVLVGAASTKFSTLSALWARLH